MTNNGATSPFEDGREGHPVPPEIDQRLGVDFDIRPANGAGVQKGRPPSRGSREIEVKARSTRTLFRPHSARRMSTREGCLLPRYGKCLWRWPFRHWPGSGKRSRHGRGAVKFSRRAFHKTGLSFQRAVSDFHAEKGHISRCRAAIVIECALRRMRSRARGSPHFGPVSRYLTICARRGCPRPS